MKKPMLSITLAALLCLMQGCECMTLCIFAPNTPVTIHYPNGTTGGMRSDHNGCVLHIPSRGFNCSSIYVTGRGRAPGFGFFTSSPDSVNIPAPPTSITIFGYNISAAYGMPTVEYNDGYGIAVGAAIATAVASDGSWLQVNIPDLSYCYTGQFQVTIVNQTWNGYGEEIGYTNLYMWGRDEPDMDGDGWFVHQDCDDSDPNVNPGAAPDCTGMYYDRNCNGIWDRDECYSGDPCEPNQGGPAPICNAY